MQWGALTPQNVLSLSCSGLLRSLGDCAPVPVQQSSWQNHCPPQLGGSPAGLCKISMVGSSAAPVCRWATGRGTKQLFWNMSCSNLINTSFTQCVLQSFMSTLLSLTGVFPLMFVYIVLSSWVHVLQIRKFWRMHVPIFSQLLISFVLQWMKLCLEYKLIQNASHLMRTVKRLQHACRPSIHLDGSQNYISSLAHLMKSL